MKPQVRIGTSGYQYSHWRGDFYPKDMPVSQWFDHYSKTFDTVEINNTFYKMPEASTFSDWKKAAPQNFLYSIKYSRFGTHLKKLKDPDSHVSYFLDRALRLEQTLGPILVQLPPNWKKNLDRLESFLKVLPGELRWAIEIRNTTWFCDELYELLKRFDTALVIHDMIPDHPKKVSTHWTYFRFHGKNYSGNYSTKQLDSIASEIRGHLRHARDVYVYFNNDLGGHAVWNALELKKMLRK